MAQNRKSDCRAESPNITGLDKRSQPRFESAQPLWREGQSAHGEHTLALNMSQSGMFIVASEDTEVGQQLHVSFRQEDEEISMDLEVMWKGKSKAGGREGLGTRIVGFSAGQDVYERFVQRSLASPADAQQDATGASPSAPAIASGTPPPATTPPPE